MEARMVLPVTDVARARVVEDLRRYGEYQQRMADDLRVEDPDDVQSSLGQLTERADTAGALAGWAEDCHRLARLIETVEPVAVLGSELELLDRVFDATYDGRPPVELVGLVEFVRDASGTGRLSPVAERTQPFTSAGVARPAASSEYVLALSREERAAIAEELRGYARYRENIASDLLDAVVLPEPGFPDPPGVTPAIEEAAGSHFGVAQECDDLAASFVSGAPTPLTPASIDLILETLDNAYIDDLPPELDRTAAFARAAHRRIVSDPDSAATGGLVVNMEAQPPATPAVAPTVAAREAGPARSEQGTLSEQVRRLAARVDDLTAQVQAQQNQLDRLGQQTGQRRSPARTPFLTAPDTGRGAQRPRSDLGL